MMSTFFRGKIHQPHIAENIRHRTTHMMIKAEKLAENKRTLPQSNAQYQSVIDALKTIHTLTRTDRQMIARCHRGIAMNICAMHDESRDDELEMRCRDLDYYRHLKEAIYIIDGIPFAEQTAEEQNLVYFSLDEIIANYYYFNIPDEAIMDDKLLRVTAKYESKYTIDGVIAALKEVTGERPHLSSIASYAAPRC